MSMDAKDAAEIRAAVQGMYDAWNRHDMQAFVAPMADDVEWVNVVGMWWRGKAQVFAAHDAMHRGMFRQRQLHAPETLEIRAVSASAAVVTIVGAADGFTTPDGRVMPPTRDALTEVWVKRDGKWLLVEGHNTTIDEGAAAHDPATARSRTP